MAGRDGITQERLHELFEYRDDGSLWWKIRPARSNPRAGTLHPKNGYRYVRCDGQRYREHRVVWMYHHGRWPIGDLDHRNRVRDDNRIENLREVSKSANQWNRDARGTSFYVRTGKWQAHIQMHGKLRGLGYFLTEEEAHQAYLVAKAARDVHIPDPMTA